MTRFTARISRALFARQLDARVRLILEADMYYKIGGSRDEYPDAHRICRVLGYETDNDVNIEYISPPRDPYDDNRPFALVPLHLLFPVIGSENERFLATTGSELSQKCFDFDSA